MESNSVFLAQATGPRLAYRAQRSHMRLLRHAGLGLLAIVLAGCLFQPGPDAAAKDWMQALAAQDGLKLGELTCDAAQTQLQNTALIYSALGVLSGSFLGGAQPKIGVDELKYQNLNAD